MISIRNPSLLPLALAVFALALLVRVGGVTPESSVAVFPPGLWFDEGLNGVDAWHTLHGAGLKLVYPDIFPREPFLVWILSGALWLFGPKVIVMRTVTAVIGSLTCVELFLAVRRTERERGPAFALAVAFVLATLHWHAWFSRLVFRTDLVPLVACLTIWAMAAAAQTGPSRRRKLIAWLGAGAIAGIGFYTYLSWYFFLPVLLIWFWALFPTEEQKTATVWDASLYFIAGAALTALPLILHYLFSPGDLMGRPQAISPFAEGFGPGLRLITRNLADVLLMFAIRGDHVPLHNVPWTPVLDPVWAFFFYAGIARTVILMFFRSSDWRRSVAWLAWLIMLSLPSVLTQTDSANTLRNLGATPAVAWFVAFGWWWIWKIITHVFKSNHLANGILLALLLWGAFFQIHKLWVRHPHFPGIVNAFNADSMHIAALARPDPDGALLFIPDLFMNKSLEFLLLTREDVHVIEQDALLLLNSSEDAKTVDRRVLCTIFTPHYGRLHALFPSGRIEPQALHKDDRPFVWIYRIPASALLEPEEAARKAAELLK